MMAWFWGKSEEVTNNNEGTVNSVTVTNEVKIGDDDLLFMLEILITLQIFEIILNIFRSKNLPQLNTILEAEVVEITHDLTQQARIPFLLNGWQSEKLKNGKQFKTQNTCAIDSIIAVYLCAYLENIEIKNTLENYNCDFAILVKNILTESNLDSSYELRNDILLNMFRDNCYPEQWNENKNCIDLDCMYGMGSTFAKLANLNDDVCSLVRRIYCLNCNFQENKRLELVPLNSDFNLLNIDQFIRKSRNIKCKVCNEILVCSDKYNNIIAFETESPTGNTLPVKLSDVQAST